MKNLKLNEKKKENIGTLTRTRYFAHTLKHKHAVFMLCLHNPATNTCKHMCINQLIITYVDL